MTKNRLVSECPNCQADIDKELNAYFWAHVPINDFEFECPECNKTLCVEVEPVPEFLVSIKK